VQIIVESRVTSAGDRGTFTMTGEINDSGIVITRRSRQEDAVVKERELRSDLGTLFIHIEGSLRDDGTAADFTWRVTGATDGYEGLTGGGSGTDEFIGTTNLRGELEGTVSR
jgi:hypothetical protein